MAQRYRVRGVVRVQETNAGIPGLVVSALNVHVEPNLQPAGGETASADAIRIDNVSERLGSVLTDATGAFELAYAFDGSGSVKQMRPHLVVVVHGPEARNGTECSEPLHVACDVRRDAGADEAYSIRIPRARLIDIGVPVPSAADADEDRTRRAVDEVTRTSKARGQIDAALRSATMTHVAALRERQKEVGEKLGDLRAVLSHASSALREKPNYVASGKSVEDANRLVLETNVGQRIHGSKQRGRMSVHADVLSGLGTPAELAAGVALTEQQFDSLRTELGMTPGTLVRTDPLANACRAAAQRRQVGVWLQWYGNGRLSRQETWKDGLQHGIVRAWDVDGRLVDTFVMHEGTGEWRLWHENGQKHLDARLRKGQPHGMWRVYYKNGARQGEAEYRDGTPTGHQRRWHPDGQLTGDVVWNDGQIVEAKSWEPDGTEMPNPLAPKD